MIRLILNVFMKERMSNVETMVSDMKNAITNDIVCGANPEVITRNFVMTKNTISQTEMVRKKKV